MRPIPFTALVAFVAILLGGCSHTHIGWEEGSIQPVYTSGPGFYSYAPSIILERGHELILACHNSEPGVIRDDIYLIQCNGAGTEVTARSVFKAGHQDAWDSFHVCDPSIVSGKFAFEGREYRYAMFYLGNNVDASQNNQVGVAFANDLQGPWKRYPEPIVSHPQNGRWGAGQPSAVYDGKGRLLLFYTKGIPQTAGYVRQVDLSDMQHPVIGSETRLSTNGLLRANGAPDYWNNFEIAFDPRRKLFWAIREKRPYPLDVPKQITSHLEIMSIPAEELFDPNARWRVEGEISPELTGHSRNHNAAFVRTATGALPNPDFIRVVFSTSCSGAGCEVAPPLWTYDLWEITGKVVRTPPTASK